MAAAIKAVNAKIRSNKVLDYFCSTRMCASPYDRIAMLYSQGALRVYLLVERTEALCDIKYANPNVLWLTSLG